MARVLNFLIIMTPAFSHLSNYNGREKTGLEEYSEAARGLNILNFCGMMAMTLLWARK